MDARQVVEGSREGRKNVTVTRAREEKERRKTERGEPDVYTSRLGRKTEDGREGQGGEVSSCRRKRNWKGEERAAEREERNSPDMGSTPVVFSNAREAKSAAKRNADVTTSGEGEKQRDGLTSNVRVRISRELLQRRHNLSTRDLLSLRVHRKRDAEDFERLSDVESDVRDGVVDKSESGIEDRVADGGDVERRGHGLGAGTRRSQGFASARYMKWRRAETNGDSEDGGHPVKVVRVGSHGENLRDDRPASPLDAEDLGQFLEVNGGGLPDREDVVSEPRHAEVAELVVEELDAELRREQGDVLDDGLSDSPLLVLGEVDDCGQQRLREEVNTND